MRRAIVLAISVILALGVAAPIAAGQNQSHSNILKELAAQWWNWAVLEPSPLAGDYEGGPQCEGGFVEGGVLSSRYNGGRRDAHLHRTC